MARARIAVEAVEVSEARSVVLFSESSFALMFPFLPYSLGRPRGLAYLTGKQVTCQDGEGMFVAR